MIYHTISYNNNFFIIMILVDIVTPIRPRSSLDYFKTLVTHIIKSTLCLRIDYSPSNIENISQKITSIFTVTLTKATLERDDELTQIYQNFFAVNFILLSQKIGNALTSPVRMRTTQARVKYTMRIRILARAHRRSIHEYTRRNHVQILSP